MTDKARVIACQVFLCSQYIDFSQTVCHKPNCETPSVQLSSNYHINLSQCGDDWYE